MRITLVLEDPIPPRSSKCENKKQHKIVTPFALI